MQTEFILYSRSTCPHHFVDCLLVSRSLPLFSLTHHSSPKVQLKHPQKKFDHHSNAPHSLQNSPHTHHTFSSSTDFLLNLLQVSSPIVQQSTDEQKDSRSCQPSWLPPTSLASAARHQTPLTSSAMTQHARNHSLITANKISTFLLTHYSQRLLHRLH